MHLTPEQRAAVSRDDRSTHVVACPGSGKTRTITAKLLRCIDTVRDTPRRVACITYTNTAVYEIEARLRRYGSAEDEQYYSVSTIHAFCITHVLRHFHWRLPGYRDGFAVAAPESEEYETAVRATCDYHNVTVSQAREGFDLLNRAVDGTPVVPAGGRLTAEMALEFWERLQASGYIDFPNIVFASYRLLHDHPSIADAVASRLAWLLLDEFQDTSALQIELLRLIAARGRTQFFLVGDPLQSIFGFAGARPDLSDRFATEINAYRDASLLTNFRSSSLVIAHADKLCPRQAPIAVAGLHANCPLTPTYLSASTVFQAITEHFLPALDASHIPYGRAAILAPWWIPLLHLGRQLREFGVPVVGPGARPYRRDRLFSRLAEHVCAYIDRRDPRVIPRIERAISELASQVTGDDVLAFASYSGRVTVYKLIHIGARLRGESESGMQWLQSAAQQFAEVLVADAVIPNPAAPLLSASVVDMQADMERNGVDIANLSVADLGLFAAPDASLELLTMHRAKGREFAAVAIIGLHEGLVPNRRATTSEEIDEGRRLLYVAITRAERLLMYITDREDARNRPSRFLGTSGLDLVPLRV